MLDNSRLRIAIQKSGRLSDDSRELLARCGIKINLHTQRLIAMAENMPIDILRVRDDDIPGLVMDGVVDLGIIGETHEVILSVQTAGDVDAVHHAPQLGQATQAAFLPLAEFNSFGRKHY